MSWDRANNSHQSSQQSPRRLKTLKLHAEEHGVSGANLAFAEVLATAVHHDILVVLLEPLDYFKATTLEEGMAASHTLREIDRILRKCSKNARTLANTVVLDIRVLFSKRMRRSMARRELDAAEDRSFAVFQKMVQELNPAVVVTCQCGAATARNQFARQMSSSFLPPVGRASIQIGYRQVPLFRAYHPSVYKPGIIEQWAGYDEQNKQDCARILTRLLELIFDKAFRDLSNVEVERTSELALREKFCRLRVDKQYLASGPSKTRSVRGGRLPN